MSTPLVSIITPTYNHEKYIEACIESVLRQTYTAWEMIMPSMTAAPITQRGKLKNTCKLIQGSNTSTKAT